MKHYLFVTALLATACTLEVSAQSIEVTNTEGLPYKFAAERVKDITFIKTTAPDVCDFNAVEASISSSGAVEATFTAADNSKTMTLFIRGPQSGNHLYDGVYTVSENSGEMTIDAHPSYSYVKEGEKSTALKSGTMNIAITGRTYTITFDFKLADESELKGKYTGEMPGMVGKDFTLNTCTEPKVLTTDVNDYVDGEFYFKMNDKDWNYEMAIDFFAAPGSPKLPAGTYTYSAEAKPGTFGSRSNLSTYSPSNNYRFAEGSTIKVTYEGDNATLELNLITTDGRKIDMKYQGSIKFPEVVAPVEEVAFNSVDAEGYSSGAMELKFYSADNTKSMTLWAHGPQDGTYLKEGTYNVQAGSSEMSIDTDPTSTFVNDNGTKKTLTAGTMNVAISGKDYTITFDFTLSDGNKLNGKYTGKIPGSTSKNFTLNTCTEPKVLTTDVNGYVDGEFYFKMNDSDWNYEMVIDFYAAPGSPKLPAGTYNYSAESKPGTFGSRSSLSTYYPSNNFKFAEGSTVEVSYEGENIKIVMNMLTKEGRNIDMTYQGPVTFPEVVTPAEEVAFNSVEADAYSSGAIELKFYSADNTKSMALWAKSSAEEKYLKEGTYNVMQGSSDMSIDTDPTSTFVNDNGTKKTLTAGTMNVAISGKDYTITFDFTLSDGSKMNGKYTGKMPNKVSKNFTLETCAEPKVMTTDVNGYVDGEFYFKMHDSDWNYELAIDFFAAPGSAKLPAGTYTYSDQNTPGTFGMHSALSTYYPSDNFKFAEGSTVDVSYEGENIKIVMNMLTTNGRSIDMTYQGTITFP